MVLALYLSVLAILPLKVAMLQLYYTTVLLLVYIGDLQTH